MEKFVIRGNKPLEGEVEVSGAKNSALKIMSSALLTDEKVQIKNVPKIQDVKIMAEVLAELGVDISVEDNSFNLQTRKVTNLVTSYELVSKMRASLVVLGPLLARAGQAIVAMPGGCNIGSRKLDLHIGGLQKLGVEVSVQQGYIKAKATCLKGNHIYLSYPSVGATENLLMASCLAKGQTVIENAAREPEIIDLARCLISMGAKISGAGSSIIKVDGVERLKGTSYQIMPDRIEAGSFLVAGAATGGKVVVKGAKATDLTMVIEKLREAGLSVKIADDKIAVSRNGKINPITISTLPFPGFPTDMQAPFVVLLSQASGSSLVTENVFENRFAYVDQLRKFGANVQLEANHALVKGTKSLRGAKVKSTDLRGGAALVIAALAAQGDSEVYDLFHIDRGYENLAEKLQKLGAEIFRYPSKQQIYKLAD